MSPLQQPQGKAQIAIHPGPYGHGASRVIEPLTAIPVKNVRIGFMTVAGQAGRYAVFGDTQSAVGAGMKMIDGFRRFPAIDTALVGINVN